MRLMKKIKNRYKLILIFFCLSVTSFCVGNIGKLAAAQDVLEKIQSIEEKQSLQFDKDLEIVKERYPFSPSQQKSDISIKLTGIVWDEKSPAAIINGVLVRKGDMIDGKEVKDITRNSVTVKEGDKEYKLELNF